MKNCKHLTHLILVFKQIFISNEKFFESIEENLPKLQYLKLYSIDCLTDNTINSLSKLSKLKYIELKSMNNYLTLSISAKHNSGRRQKIPQVQ